jgi:hypothetical protein
VTGGPALGLVSAGRGFTALREDRMSATFDSAAHLAAALRRAEAAHGKYEEEIGRPDPNWPDWYAQYMVDEQTGRSGPGAGR